MIARTLDELLTYRKSLAASKAVSAILLRPKVCADWDLREQLASASASVPANIAEGFGQQTDRLFVKYLYIARGSAHEVRAHLVVACNRGYIDELETLELSSRYEEIAKMTTGLIRYLRASDRKQRG